MQKIRLKLISGEQCTKKLRFTQLGQEFELSNSSLCASSEDDSRDTGIVSFRKLSLKLNYAVFFRVLEGRHCSVGCRKDQSRKNIFPYWALHLGG